jgi:hypothetical protein
VNLTAAQALRIPEFVAPAEAEALVRWSEEAAPVLEAFVRRPVSGRRAPLAERQAAHRAHVVLALLARIAQMDGALRSVTAERDAARKVAADAQVRLSEVTVERNNAVLRIDAAREALESYR